jgi:hypothetical protein
MAPSETALLQALAEADGLTISDVVRLLVRRAYADRFGDKKPTKSKPKK